ncbi:MAG: class I SAM-dependent methyltransferase [Candidatus Diapherotrites archaeon]
MGSNRQKRHRPELGGEAQEENLRRRYPWRRHPDNLTGRFSAKISFLMKVMSLDSRIHELSELVGGPDKVKVLEIGAQSGRLAEHLIKNYGLHPKNYVIGDIDYPEKGRDTGPRLVKKVFLWVEQGLMKKKNINLLRPPSKDIGKFHLIIIPRVSARRDVIDSLVKNYIPLLEKGGRIVIDRYIGFDGKGKFNLPNLKNIKFLLKEPGKYFYEESGVLTILKTK